MTEKQKEALIRRCRAALKKDPDCVWAKNELRYIDDEREAPMPVNEAGGAYAADFAYHGGYVE